MREVGNPMDEMQINWATAEVKNERGSLALTVELAAEPDQFWRNAWAELAQRLAYETGRPAVPDSVSSYSRAIRVDGVEPGSERAVRRMLEEMVVNTNRSAVRAREKSAQERAQAQAADEAREASVKSMTDRFRTG
jgi:hypothetical protein